MQLINVVIVSLFLAGYSSLVRPESGKDLRRVHASSSSKYSPDFSTDKSIERYRKVARKADQRVKRDRNAKYYHVVSGISERNAKFFRKAIEKRRKQDRRDGKRGNYPDYKSGSEIVRTHLKTEFTSQLFSSLSAGHGLVLPVFNAGVNRHSDIRITINWPETEKLHKNLNEHLNLNLHPLSATKEWVAALRSHRSDGHKFSASTQDEIIKRLSFAASYIVDTGLVGDYYQNFIKYGNQDINVPAINSLTERLISGDATNIQIIPTELLSMGFTEPGQAASACVAFNLTELKINNQPKPSTEVDLGFRLSGAIRRAQVRKAKSLETCIRGFRELWGLNT